MKWLAPMRYFHIVPDVGEEHYAEHLSDRLMQAGAIKSTVNPLPRKLGHGGDLCTMAADGGIRRVAAWLHKRVA